MFMDTRSEGQGEPVKLVAGRGEHGAEEVGIGSHEIHRAGVTMVSLLTTWHPSLSPVNTARETGLNLAVATMVPGELARIEVAPRYGFGVAGSFSFPTVPPHAGLVYELELLDYEEVDEVRGGFCLIPHCMRLQRVGQSLETCRRIPEAALV